MIKLGILMTIGGDYYVSVFGWRMQMQPAGDSLLYTLLLLREYRTGERFYFTYMVFVLHSLGK